MMDAETQEIPAPASPSAKAAGCACDARLNRDGAGAGTNGNGDVLFVTNARCKVHGTAAVKKRERAA